MYDQPLVFGPLTLAQTIYIAGSIGAAFLVHENFPELGFAAPLALGLIGVALAYKKRPNRIEHPAEYFKQKYATDPEARKLLAVKVAEVQSQIHERKARGMAPDSKLEEAAQSLEQLHKELESSVSETEKPRS